MLGEGMDESAGDPFPLVEKFVSLGRLYLKPLQFFLSDSWTDKNNLDMILRISEEVKSHLRWWLDPLKLSEGVSLKLQNPDLVLSSDVSTTGWGAMLGGEEVSGTWRGEQVAWHINLKELAAIQLALQFFQDKVSRRVVHVNSDNTTALAYLKKQGGTHSRSLFALAKGILLWAKARGVTILTRFVAGVENVRADLLSRQEQLLPTEWTLHQEVCQELWSLWGCPLVDIFATSKTTRLPLYCSPVLDPGAVAIDSLLWDWTGRDLYAFPPFKILGEVLRKFAASEGTRLTLIAPFWPAANWFTEVMSFLVDFPRTLPSRRDLLKQPHFERYHKNLSALSLTAFRLSRSWPEQEVFQNLWQKLLPPQGGLHQLQCTNRSGQLLGAGARRRAFPLPRPL
ncbi:uncharacterized protein LOC135195853 [Macrobrachium nipponense]|uniref:uncharacterized protein LOC135195853 n=1 Tax=Macrobrachium nipponense TaxID=159736 RepID=UPI0030C87E71